MELSELSLSFNEELKKMLKDNQNREKLLSLSKVLKKRCKGKISCDELNGYIKILKEGHKDKSVILSCEENSQLLNDLKK